MHYTSFTLYMGLYQKFILNLEKKNTANRSMSYVFKSVIFFVKR